MHATKILTLTAAYSSVKAIIIDWEGAVGGVIVPVDKLGLLAPYIALVVVLIAATIGAVYVGKRWFGKDAFRDAA